MDAAQDRPLPFAPLQVAPWVQPPTGPHAPLMHTPEAHSAPDAHPVPLGAVPTQVPPVQSAVALHSGSPLHVASQLLVPVQ